MAVEMTIMERAVTEAAFALWDRAMADDIAPEEVAALTSCHLAIAMTKHTPEQIGLPQ